MRKKRMAHFIREHVYMGGTYIKSSYISWDNVTNAAEISMVNKFMDSVLEITRKL